MIAVGLLSLALTRTEDRKANRFEWEPFKEVAQLFAGIFICIIPVMAIMQAGDDGPFAPVLALLTDASGAPRNAVYFWATGLLSSFLDNAPTYLVFFQLAGGDPAQLMGPASCDARRDFARRRLHGRHDLHRQRTEFHGLCDRAAPARRDAEFFSAIFYGRG